jgi:hypothetical protein
MWGGATAWCKESLEAAAFAGLVAMVAVMSPPGALAIVALRFLALVVTRSARGMRRSMARTAPCLLGGALVLGLAGGVFGLEFALLLALVWRVFAESDASARFAAFRARTPFGAKKDLGLARLGSIWAVPLLGLAHQLGLNGFGLWIATAVTVICLIDWLIRRLADWRIGMLDTVSAFHIAVHNGVFATACVLMPDPTSALVVLAGYRAALCAPVPILTPQRAWRQPAAA